MKGSNIYYVTQVWTRYASVLFFKIIHFVDDGFYHMISFIVLYVFFYHLGICGKGNNSAWRGRNNGHDGVADPYVVHVVWTFIRKQLASELRSEFLSRPIVWSCLRLLNIFFIVSISSMLTFFAVENNRSTEEYVFNHSNFSRHALKNVALGIYIFVAY